MVTYRATVKDDAYKNRYMMSPTVKIEAKRESKDSLTRILAAFERLLRENPPIGRNAAAWCEKSDRFGLHVLVRMKDQNGQWVKE